MRTLIVGLTAAALLAGPAAALAALHAWDLPGIPASSRTRVSFPIGASSRRRASSRRDVFLLIGRSPQAAASLDLASAELSSRRPLLIRLMPITRIPIIIRTTQFIRLIRSTRAEWLDHFALEHAVHSDPRRCTASVRKA